MNVVYAIETYPELSVEAFIDVLRRSTLGERRPIDDPETIRGMLEHADIIVTARVEGRLVGISRAITDFSYCTYLSDLAVDEAYQRPRDRQGADPTDARGGRSPDAPDLARRPQGQGLLSAHRHDRPRFLLDDPRRAKYAENVKTSS